MAELTPEQKEILAGMNDVDQTKIRRLLDARSQYLRAQQAVNAAHNKPVPPTDPVGYGIAGEETLDPKTGRWVGTSPMTPEMRSKFVLGTKLNDIEDAAVRAGSEAANAEYDMQHERSEKQEEVPLLDFIRDISKQTDRLHNKPAASTQPTQKDEFDRAPDERLLDALWKYKYAQQERADLDKKEGWSKPTSEMNKEELAMYNAYRRAANDPNDLISHSLDELLNTEVK